ncbi:MAG: PrsW family intramembrane metalloprotease [Kofleriaceae bacterium]|nr:PrsW family intramembrane metalloprotease [Kofleriaceae bacterium]
MRAPKWSLRRARSLVGGKFLFIGGLLGFIGFAWLVERLFGLNKPLSLGPLLAAAMAVIPAGLWLGFFYLWDRHEPEPRHLVAGVFALGLFIAGPLAEFIRAQAVPPLGLEHQSTSLFSLDRIVYAVLVLGLAQEVCKYAVVRYSVYLSKEFDEPMDGVIYMMAVGTGFATWDNYHRLSELGNNVFLSIGAAKAVVNTLAHASFAGALGYVMGRAKFTRRSAPVRGLLLFLGLLGAAGLNGQFALMQTWLNNSGMKQYPWRGIAYAAAVAALVFGGLMLAARRLLHDSPFRRGDHE